MANRGSPSSYIPTLDGWRAVAVLGTVACHARPMLVQAGMVGESGWLYALASRADLGVDIFFGISGYLITTHLVREEQERGRISLRSFYERRVFRILPASFFYLFVLSALAALGQLPVSRSELLACVALSRNYFTGDTWYTGHFWSLAVEEHFYLAWPLLMVLAGPRRRVPLALASVLTIAGWRSFEFHHQLLSKVLPGVSFFLRTDTRADGLMAGCLIGLLLSDSMWRGWISKVLSPVSWSAFLSVFLLVAAYDPPFRLLWIALLIPLLIAGTALHPTSIVARILEWQPFRWMGRLSYSIYLWQQLWIVASPADYSPALGFLQRWPFGLLMILPTAALSYYLVEKPMIALGARIRSRRVEISRAVTIPARAA